MSGEDGECAEGSAGGLSDETLDGIIESLLLVADAPLDPATVADVLAIPENRIRHRFDAVRAGLDERRSGMELRQAPEGWGLYTRKRNARYVERFLLDGSRATLTRAALETLAVVAYRQPVTRARVGAVRGVNVDGVMRTLVSRGLVAEADAEPQTRATTYVTTDLFLERLGLDALDDLPPLAPLLPDEDVVEYIGDNLDDEPRVAKARERPPAAPTGDTTETSVDDDE